MYIVLVKIIRFILDEAANCVSGKTVLPGLVYPHVSMLLTRNDLAGNLGLDPATGGTAVKIGRR